MKQDGRLAILVVEDSDADRRLLQSGLAREFSPRPAFATAATCEKACALLCARHYDVVLLDLTLPGCSGLAAIRRVLAVESPPPVVVFTEGGEARLGLEAVELGAEDFLVKGEAHPAVVARVVRYAIARHRVAAELRRTTEVLEAVTSGTDVIVAAVDRDLRYIFFDAAYRDEVLRLCGTAPALGTTIGETFARLPEQARVAEEQWRRTLAGEAQQYRIAFGDPGRYRRVYSVRHTPIRDARGTVVGAGEVAFDITAQDAAERARDESEGKYRLLFERMAEGFALYELVRDAADRPADWRVLEVNAAYERQTGLPAAQIRGQRIGGIFPAAAAEYLPRFARVVATGRPETFETLSIATGRHHRVTTFPAGGDRFASIISDVTARRRAEAGLARQASHNELVAAAAGALLGARVPAKAVAAVARRAMRHLGCELCFNYLLDEWAGNLRLNASVGVGRAEAERLARLDLGAAVCGRVAQDGKPIVAERIHEAPDERTALVHSFGVRAYVCHPLRAEDGRVIGTLSFGSRTRDSFAPEDVALMRTLADLVSVALVRQRAEERSRLANELLEARVAKRTAELRRVSSELVLAEQRERSRLAGFLHDHLQQLLAGAKLAVGNLRLRPEGAALAQPLGAIEDQLAAAVRASRSLTGELSPPVLSSRGLPAALEWLASRMEEDHGLLVQVSTAEWAPVEDQALRVLLFQSVKELLFNVAKHAGVGRAEVRLARAREGLSVEVRDEGRGFDPATPETGRGVSYGLFSVAERVRQMGGTLDVSSAPGRGTVVRIAVPEDPAAAEARPPRGA